MGLSVRLAALRYALRQWLGRHETLLEFIRLVRYAIIQGPWGPWFVRRYQADRAGEALATHPETLFPEMDVEETVARLSEDAYSPSFQVPRELVEEIVAYAHADGGKRIDDSHLRCPAVQRVALDPNVVRVARAFIGAEPILFNSRLYWTIPTPDAQGRVSAPAEGGRYHYDVADVRAVTLFVYLTDVDEDSGPHVVVRGTHGRRRFFEVFRRFLPDEVIQERFGDRIEVITGSRGTSWFEDITCFHKQTLGSKVRLMLALIYSLRRRAEVEVRPGLARAPQTATP